MFNSNGNAPSVSASTRSSSGCVPVGQSSGSDASHSQEKQSRRPTASIGLGRGGVPTAHESSPLSSQDNDHQALHRCRAWGSGPSSISSQPYSAPAQGGHMRAIVRDRLKPVRPSCIKAFSTAFTVNMTDRFDRLIRFESRSRWCELLRALARFGVKAPSRIKSRI